MALLVLVLVLELATAVQLYPYAGHIVEVCLENDIDIDFDVDVGIDIEGIVVQEVRPVSWWEVLRSTDFFMSFKARRGCEMMDLYKWLYPVYVCGIYICAGIVPSKLANK